MSFAFLPLYTGDYLRDTRHLTPLKHGVYILLLMHSWDQQGPLPLDEQECAGIANCRSADEVEALRYILARFFVQMDDGHYNKRMQAEVAKANAISRKRSLAGLARHGQATLVKVGYKQRKRSAKLTAARAIGTHTKQEWVAMVEFHEGRCACCQSQETMMIKDHVISLHEGGDDSIGNLQPLCYNCNHSKGGNTKDYRKIGWSQHVLTTCTEGATTLTPTPTLNPTPTSKRENPFVALTRDILSFLNQKAGKGFKPVVANLRFIEARLREGATEQELRQVIAMKCREWSNNPDMAKYLRPETLFNATKFAQYQGELNAPVS